MVYGVQFFAMGGHSSKQSATFSSKVITNAVMNITQNCVSTVAGNQSMDVEGSGNTFSGNSQTATLQVNSGCMSQLSQNGDFVNQLKGTLQQKLHDQQVALTGWLNPGSDTQQSSVNEAVTTNIDYKDVQECINKLDGSQVMLVEGDNNTDTGNTQMQSLAVASKCIMNGAQTSRAANTLTDIVNQHSVYLSKNPLAFITDAVDAAIRSAMILAALAFVVVVILVFLVGFLHERKKSKRAAVASPPAPVSGN